MNFFSTLRASATAQCRALFYGIMENALATSPEEMLEWHAIDPLEFDLDDDSEDSQPVMMKRVSMPMFVILNPDIQLAFADEAATDIEITYGVHVGVSHNEETGEILVYLSSARVDVNLAREFFDDNEEIYAAPSHADVSESFALLDDDDIRFLEYVRSTIGEQAFDDVTFNDDDETSLREFFMGDDSAEELQITNACLDALRNEYDVEEEEEEEAPASDEDEADEADTNGKSPLSLVPRINAPAVDDFEPENDEFEAEKAAEADDFESEQADPAEREQETIEQDEALNTPDNAAEESFVSEPSTVVMSDPASDVKVETPPAALPVDDEEFQRARLLRVLEEFAKDLPVDTISEIDHGVLTVMMTREVEGHAHDYVLRVRVAHENFAGVKMMDIFYLETEAGEQLSRSTNAKSVLEVIAAL